MKGIAVVALGLGIAGTILGAIALIDGGGVKAQTLQLRGGKETRVPLRAQATIKRHPLKGAAWSSNEAVRGDRTGEYVRTCVPLPTDEIECSGAFLLRDRVVIVDGLHDARPSDATTDGAIVGGTGAYAGAAGSYQLDWKKNIYTLNLKLLK